LVDDGVTNFGEAIDVRFAGTKVAAFDRVIKEAVNAIAIVRVVLRRVNAALGSDAMGPARAILITKRFDVITLLGQGRGRRTAGQSRADDDDLKPPAIVRRNQLGIVLVLPPFLEPRRKEIEAGLKPL